jgi:hypothetical protein
MNFATINIYWFLLPLVLAISVVYAASRYESWPRIWVHAGRTCATILIVLAVATVLLTCINGCA